MDDSFHDHPKVEELSLAAVGLWAKCWSKALGQVKVVSRERRGFVSEATARGYAGSQTKRLVAELTRVIPGKKHGMWEPVEGGWMIHDFADYLPKQRDPAEAAESGRRGANAKWGKGKPVANSHSSSHSNSQADSHDDSQGDSQANPMADGMAKNGPRASRVRVPDPEGGGSNSGGGRPETLHAPAATNPPQRPTDGEARCARHPHGNPGDEPCAGCARVRERQDRAAEREAERQRLALEQARRDCPDCEGTGKVLDPDTKLPTRRTCTHPTARRTA